MADPRSVLLRADASTAIGTGHVVRCLALGTRLRDRGWSVTLAGRMPADLLAEAATSGVRGLELPEWLGVADEPSYLAEAGVLGDLDVAVTDHYGLGHAWHREVALAGPALAAIDDLAAGPLDVRLVVNQNLGATPSDYEGLVDPGTVVLGGPRYALLRPGFAAARAGLRVRSGALRRVLVFLSGADEHDVTGRAARVAEAAGLEVDVVIGGAYPFAERLAAWTAGRPRVRLHRATPAMAELMAAADLAVGAPGSASWERCCVGLPAVLVVLAANQETNAARLDAAGVAISLGWHDRLDDARLGASLEALRADPDRLREMGRAAATLCDGLGADRVADALEALAAPRRAA